MTDTGRRVLVIEDDPNLAEVVTLFLRRDGHEVEVRADGTAGLRRALEWQPDLLILDLMLPGTDGFEVCRRVRETAPIPVIMLTAHVEEEDRVLGLELGADDYVTKPFSPRELALRAAAVMRRAALPLSPSVAAPLTAGPFEADPAAHEARRDGETVALTAKEFDLLLHFMRNPRRGFDRRQLMQAVWGWSYGDTATVTVHVRRLRAKLEPDPAAPVHFVTVPGGYRFDP